RLQSKHRSARSTIAIRRSLIALFLQLVAPLTLFVIPAIVIFIGLLNENSLTFEFLMVLFLILQWHSIAHNVILISITSAYRNVI
ncbi:hypothetical protein PFISCL1PPCAC_16828, partial [Pristionchus fissidentatus]